MAVARTDAHYEGDDGILSLGAGVVLTPCHD